MTRKTILGCCAFLLSSCATTPPAPKVIPALEYSRKIQEEEMARQQYRGKARINPAKMNAERHPTVRLASESMAESEFGAVIGGPEVITNMIDEGSERVLVQESTSPDIREYQGPLVLGDPGVTASLYRESRSAGEFFRDDRAWQPMDLITILISERSKGSKQADTEVKSKSSVAASISKFIGLESSVKESNPSIDPTALVEAETKNDFKGEGDTSREGTLQAKISAMVAEVLPSGILRVEGQKIISVNSEEEIMVISGLVKPTDVNSFNEVESSKIANMRIDYYGYGTVGDAQHGGWIGRLMKRFWPF